MQRRSSQAGFTLLELVVVIIVISILGLFAIDRIWSLRIAAEKAAVTRIIGNIRSALGLEVSRLALQQSINQVAKLENSNPMKLLAQVPPDYIGEQEDPKKIPDAGNWYYDVQQQALIYTVVYSDYFNSPLQGPARIRYRIKLDYDDKNHNGHFDTGIDSIGGLDLVPLEKYYWNVQ